MSSWKGTKYKKSGAEGNAGGNAGGKNFAMAKRKFRKDCENFAMVCTIFRYDS